MIGATTPMELDHLMDLNIAIEARSSRTGARPEHRGRLATWPGDRGGSGRGNCDLNHKNGKLVDSPAWGQSLSLQPYLRMAASR